MKRFAYLVHERRWADSRVADMLTAQGHQVDFVCHACGDNLPAISDIDGLIVGGGQVSVWQAPEYPFMARQIDYVRTAVEAGLPYIGTCLGAQILGAAFGASSGERVDRRGEFGFYEIEPTAEGTEFFEPAQRVFQVHFEAVDRLPAEGTLLASSELFENQAFRIGERAFGLQFHPDARADMIPAWWHDYASLLVGRGGQTLEQQVKTAQELEPSRSEWVERFVERWVGASVGV